MFWRRAVGFALWNVALSFALMLCVFAWNVRAPQFVMLRPWPPIALLSTGAVFCLLAFFITRRRARWIRWSLLAPALDAMALGAATEARMAWLKARVLAAPPTELRAAARHLIVGFGDFADLDPLVTKAGVAGVFIGRRNARGRDDEELAAQVRRLQELRRDSGLPPLFVATDQEGGSIAALSPPLPRPPALSTLTHAGELVVEAAEQAARDLACVGVNVNFAPVVDIGRGLDDNRPRASDISRRAISSDERTVTQTARDYCRALAEAGVQCTLKHFPGLGAADGDTHRSAVAIPELREQDLFPFREIARDEPPWIMFGHVTVESLDHRSPASASAKAIDIVRGDWGFEGILVTDDIGMAAYSDDLRGNILTTMRGGVDLLLASYDPDLAWVALDTLLSARRENAPLVAAMNASGARLARHPAQEPFCRRLALAK